MYLYLLQSPTTDERPDPSRWAETLRNHLAGHNDHVDAVREQIVDSAQVDYRGLSAMLLPPPWYRGHVVLIGDAAHTTTPHLAYGVAMAVEDGVVRPSWPRPVNPWSTCSPGSWSAATSVAEWSWRIRGCWANGKCTRGT